MPDIQTHPSGAQRERLGDQVRYDLISPIALERLAATLAQGASRYGDRNWEKGLPFSDTLNHLLRHIYKYIEGDKSEDHLAHAAFGLFALMHFETTMPEMNDLPWAEDV